MAYPGLVDDAGDFAQIGEAFAATRLQRTGQVGAGSAFLMHSRDVVDFATGWLSTNRNWARQ